MPAARDVVEAMEREHRELAPPRAAPAGARAVGGAREARNLGTRERACARLRRQRRVGVAGGPRGAVEGGVVGGSGAKSLWKCRARVWRIWSASVQ